MTHMTYRIALIVGSADLTTTHTAEGVPMYLMKDTIRRMVKDNNIPANATLQVEQENPRVLYFRNLLSSVPSVSPPESLAP